MSVNGILLRRRDDEWEKRTKEINADRRRRRRRVIALCTGRGRVIVFPLLSPLNCLPCLKKSAQSPSPNSLFHTFFPTKSHRQGRTCTFDSPQSSPECISIRPQLFISAYLVAQLLAEWRRLRTRSSIKVSVTHGWQQGVKACVHDLILLSPTLYNSQWHRTPYIISGGGGGNLGNRACSYVLAESKEGRYNQQNDNVWLWEWMGLDDFVSHEQSASYYCSPPENYY